MIRRITAFGLAVLFIIVSTLASIFTHSAAVAQSDQVTLDFATTATPGSEGEPLLTPPADIVATHEAESATLAAEFNSRSIFDFQVAYLIAQDAVSSGSLASAQSITSVFDAEVMNSWSDFLDLNQAQAFHIVLIHESMYGQVDKAWLQNAYRNQVFIVGINMSFEHLADITGDSCLRDPNPGLLDRFGNMYLYFTYNVKLQNESLRDFVNTSELEICEPYQVEDGSSVSMYHGTVNAPFFDEETLYALATSLVLDTVAYGIPKPQQNLLPVPSAPDQENQMRGNS